MPTARPQKPRRRLAYHVLDVSIVGVILLAFGSFGGSLAASRKGRRPHPQVSLSDTAPDTTSTIAAKGSRAATGPLGGVGQDDDTLPPLFHLPTASRARMRECGEKWQRMKMSGDVGEEIWRRFATSCLAEADKAAEKPSP